jgi:hypothetical protein
MYLNTVFRIFSITHGPQHRARKHRGDKWAMRRLILGKWDAQIGVLGFTKIKKWSVSDVQSLRMLLSDGECRNSDGIGH